MSSPALAAHSVAEPARDSDGHQRIGSPVFAGAGDYRPAGFDHRQRTVQRRGGGDPGIGADAAASIVQSRYGGRVLSVKPTGGAYSVKVLHPNGSVVVYQVDRQTGQIR